MTDAVIVSTARTGLAKSWKGAFNMTYGAACSLKTMADAELLFELISQERVPVGLRHGPQCLAWSSCSIISNEPASPPSPRPWRAVRGCAATPATVRGCG